jgi:hypothetical protein
MSDSGVVGARWRCQNQGMRTLKIGLSCALLACGGTDRALQPEPSDRSLPGVQPASAEGGPICPRCVIGGGESSDFDGGQDPCVQFVHTAVPVSAAEVQAAGIDADGFRSALERSFESELSWKDLTTSTAGAREPGLSGFQSQTRISGSVATGDWEKDYFDATSCDGFECPLGNGQVGNCANFAFEPRYLLATRVTLATADGAVAAVLRGRASLPEAPSSTDSALALPSFGASADASEVQGTLRVEPLPGNVHGTMTVTLSYYPDFVRGALRLEFTNWTAGMSGSGAKRTDERPLVGKFPSDVCEPSVLPAPLDAPHPRLHGRTPGDLLDELRTAIGASSPMAGWTPSGQATELQLEVGTPEYACVDHWDRIDGRPYSQITNLPLHASTSDGLLDWSEVAEYRFDDSSGVGRHSFAVRRELPPSAAVLHQDLQQFPLPPGTQIVFVGLRADYPGAGLGPGATSSPARVSFAFTTVSDCPGNDPACNEAYRAFGPAEYCLAAPAGGACTYRPAAQALLDP